MYGHNKMRFHSIERVIDELESILNRLDLLSLLGLAMMIFLCIQRIN